MAHKIEDIEGIGEHYGEILRNAGIKTTEELLASCRTPKQRAELAEKTGISSKLILRWANHADLFRINGVAGQFSEILEKAGVDTVKEFRHRNAENLRAKMEETNAQYNLVNRLPSVEMLQKMIDEAKTMEPMLEY